jgi:hypothetical protein
MTDLNTTEIDVINAALRQAYSMRAALRDMHRFPLVVRLGDDSLTVAGGTNEIRAAALDECDRQIRGLVERLRKEVGTDTPTDNPA